MTPTQNAKSQHQLKTADYNANSKRQNRTPKQKIQFITPIQNARIERQSENPDYNANSKNPDCNARL